MAKGYVIVEARKEINPPKINLTVSEEGGTVGGYANAYLDLKQAQEIYRHLGAAIDQLSKPNAKGRVDL